MASQRFSKSKMVKLFGFFSTNAVQRITFQQHLINGLLNEDDSSVSEEEMSDCDVAPQIQWMSRVPVTLSDCGWLIHDRGERGIHVKSRSFPDCSCEVDWHLTGTRFGIGGTQLLQHHHQNNNNAKRHTLHRGPAHLRFSAGRGLSQSVDSVVPIYSSTPVSRSGLEHGQQDSASACRCQLYRENDPIQLIEKGSNKQRQEAALQDEDMKVSPESGYQTPTSSSGSEGSTGTSTPSGMKHGEKSAKAGGSSYDPEANKKISDLEEELLRLKQQIAVLVVSQEQMAKNQWKPGDSLQIENRNIGNEAIPLPPPPPPPQAAGGGGVPAPPPPPPPPPVVLKHSKSVQDIILERKQSRGSSVSGNSKSCTALGHPAGPDMSEVLKGISTVKLRAVKRSPGGTPIREPPRSCDNTDPASLIARALKKKFSYRQLIQSPDPKSVSPRDHPMSPNSGDFGGSPKLRKLANGASSAIRRSGGGDNLSSWNVTPPGQHVLKKSYRHSVKMTFTSSKS